MREQCTPVSVHVSTILVVVPGEGLVQIVCPHLTYDEYIVLKRFSFTGAKLRKLIMYFRQRSRTLVFPFPFHYITSLDLCPSSIFHPFEFLFLPSIVAPYFASTLLPPFSDSFPPHSLPHYFTSSFPSPLTPSIPPSFPPSLYPCLTSSLPPSLFHSLHPFLIPFLPLSLPPSILLSLPPSLLHSVHPSLTHSLTPSLPSSLSLSLFSFSLSTRSG